MQILPQAILQKLYLADELGKGILWNLVSLAFLSIAGLAIQGLVARAYGPSTYGVFNQTYAIYILLSQIAVGGFHLSVQKHVSELTDGDGYEQRGHILGSALILTTVVSFVVGFVFYRLRFFIGNILDSEAVALGVMYIAPGLVFFGLNKVLLAFLNGLRDMRSYAVFQALRFLLMGAFVSVWLFKNFSGDSLPLIFTFSEVALSTILLPYVLLKSRLMPVRVSRRWLQSHLGFGVRVFWSGALTEVNTKVDILLLGFFSTDRVVGIYAIAAMIVEGIFQMLVVVRTNLNPIIARLYSRGDIPELKRLISVSKRVVYQATAVFGLITLVMYPIIFKIIGLQAYLSSWPVFAILLAGLIASAGYVPLDMILVQAGRPGLYALLVMATFLINAVANLALIPPLGLYGAALATALAFLSDRIILRRLALRAIRINI